MADVIEGAGAARPDAAAAPGRAVIQAGPLVILRESELDCDLATAIQRVRDCAETNRSRILIIGAEPVPPETVGGPRVLPAFPTTLGQVVRLGEKGALASVGQRLVPLIDCLDRFLVEFGDVLDDLDSHDDMPLARLAARRRTLREVLDWARAVATDLRQEAEGAIAGYRAVDLRELLQEAIRQVEALYPAVRVHATPGVAGHAYWGRSADLVEALYLALGLVAMRIGGRGAITVELAAGRDELSIRVRGLGAAVEVEDADAVDRLRQIAAGHGARILPDLGGLDGTGLTLVLPLGPLGLPA